MKVHSLTILHYGKDYLSYALRSVYSQVDQAHVFYTPTPSHGHSTNISPVETKEELLDAAFAHDPEKKIRWYDMLNISHEGQQRDLALEKIKEAGADIVIVLDYDEIWPEITLKRMIDRVKAFSLVRNHLVNMIHFWRSFNYACYDNGWPVRIIDLRWTEGTTYQPAELGRIYHFGYAITDRVMTYKWQIHGHKNELRPDWLKGKWQKWPPEADCHPTNENGFWIPEPFNKARLPELMREHEFYGLEKIE